MNNGVASLNTLQLTNESYINYFINRRILVLPEEFHLGGGVPAAADLEGGGAEERPAAAPVRGGRHRRRRHRRPQRSENGLENRCRIFLKDRF